MNNADSMDVAINPMDMRSSHSVRWGFLYLLVFALLTLIHSPILTAPPYDDFACVFYESVWLSENNFDVVRLRDTELPFRRGGGPLIYLTSVVPFFFALLMKYGPGNPANLVVGHLTMLALASLILTLAFALIRRQGRLIPALLATAVLATFPTFQSQVEMLGVDVPMTAFALLAVFFADRNKPVLAALSAFASFWMKPTGLIVTVALLGVLLLRLAFVARSPRERFTGIVGVLVNVSILGTQSLVLQWSRLAADLRHPAYEKLVPFVPITHASPDLLAICILAILAFLLWAPWRTVLSCRTDGILPQVGSLGRAGRFVQAESVSLVCAAIIVGCLGAIFFHARLPVPRYFLLPATVSVVLLGRILADFPRMVAIAPIAIALNLVNLNGSLYPSMDRLPCPRAGAIWERSLEYRDDLNAIRVAIGSILADSKGTVVVAPHHITHGLAMPELGYTDVPVPGFAASEYTRTNFPSVSLMMKSRPRDVIFVSVDSLSGSLFSHIDIPGPSPGDTILFDERRNSPMVVYRTRLPETPAEYDQWCLDHLWYGREDRLERSFVPLMTRAELLSAAGRPDLADRLLQMRIDRHPDNEQAKLDYAELKLQFGRHTEAKPILDSVLRKNPGISRAWILSARASAAAGNATFGRSLIDRAILTEPTSATAWFWKGKLETQLSDDETARVSFQRSFDLDPLRADAPAELASIAIRQNQLSDADRWLETAVHLSPYDPNLHFLRAAVLDHLNRTSEATRSLAAAARLDPRWKSTARPLSDPVRLIQSPSNLRRPLP